MCIRDSYCGYLALMGALATGAERFYLHEAGVTMRELVEDVEEFKHAFQHGKRLGLIIRNEKANEVYSTHFMRTLFEEEGGDLIIAADGRPINNPDDLISFLVFQTEVGQTISLTIIRDGQQIDVPLTLGQRP